MQENSIPDLQPKKGIGRRQPVNPWELNCHHKHINLKPLTGRDITIATFITINQKHYSSIGNWFEKLP